MRLLAPALPHCCAALPADTRVSLPQESEGSAVISPWHDIALRPGADGVYNFLNEIPKMSKKKMEVMTKEPHNPIAQDTKKGKLREYHGPIFWNYGCLPQTWCEPSPRPSAFSAALRFFRGKSSRSQLF